MRAEPMGLLIWFDPKTESIELHSEPTEVVGVPLSMKGPAPDSQDAAIEIHGAQRLLPLRLEDGS